MTRLVTRLTILSLFLVAVTWFATQRADVGQSSSAGAHYVDDNDSTCGLHVPCYTTIQEAINASKNGDTVLVRPGTYQENLYVYQKGLTLQSTSGPETTVIDGGAQSTTVLLQSEQPVTVRGFTIRNAARSGGSHNGYGILAITPKGGTVNIEDNIIKENHADGGVKIDGHAPSKISLARNQITDDTGDIGGGVRIELSDDAPGSIDITNNVIAFNQGATGGGLAFSGCCPFSPGELLVHVGNNTIYGNSAEYGGGMEANIGNLTIDNNIFAANTADYSPDVYLVQASLNAGVNHNIVEETQFNGINGNMSADPLLTDPMAGDFHLLSGSPAIDAGANEGAPDSDFEGDGRPTDGDGDGTYVVDIGADEYCLQHLCTLAETPATATPTATFRLTPKPTFTPTSTRVPPPALRLGDVNCDSSANSIDAALILQFVAGLYRGGGPQATCPFYLVADVNHDGRIDAIDAAIILQYVAGLLDHLPP